MLYTEFQRQILPKFKIYNTFTEAEFLTKYCEASEVGFIESVARGLYEKKKKTIFISAY